MVRRVQIILLNKTSDGNTENQEDENQLDEIKEDNIEAARKHVESKDAARVHQKLINDQQHDCVFLDSK